MSAVRELRGLVPLEIACVLAVVVLPVPELLPVGIPLLVVASLSRWLRGRSWGERLGGAGGVERVLVGAAAGAVAIGVAASVYEVLEVSALAWWVAPVVRGGAPGEIALVIAVLVASGAALELALRGWIVERALELAPWSRAWAILIGALAEALVTPGAIAVRLGAALFGVGLGALYVAAGRDVRVPIAARSVFVTGAVLVEVLAGR